jgi:hypothetical protein
MIPPVSPGGSTVYQIFFLLITHLSFAALTPKDPVQWKKNPLSVCFAQSSNDLISDILMQPDNRLGSGGPLAFTENEMELLKTTLQKTYTLESTGVYFEGFLPCEHLPKADVVLIMRQGQNYIANTATIGDTALEPPYLPRTSIQFTTAFFRQSTPTSMLSILVHEFGHVAGLLHEFVGAERDQEFMLTLRSFDLTGGESFNRIMGMAGAESKSMQVKYGVLRRLTPPDPFSIMNYMSIDNFMRAKGVSLFCDLYFSNNLQVLDPNALKELKRNFRDDYLKNSICR